MKRILLGLVLLLGVAAFLNHSKASSAGASLVLNSAKTEVYFSPNGGAQAAVVRAISDAKESIFVQAYSFTSAPIAAALKSVHDRKLKVFVILDKSQISERYTSATFLKHAGIVVYIDSAHAIAHNKVMVIDMKTVVTGSFNFTKSAEESNAENLLIIRDTTLAEAFAKNWNAHLQHSTAL